MYSRIYGGVIWSKHALKRLSERGLTQKLAWEAFQYPQSSTLLDRHGTMDYKRKVGNSEITVIAKRGRKQEWIIVSCWVNPPIPGTIDAKRKIWYKKYHQAGFWKKFLLAAVRSLTGRDY